MIKLTRLGGLQMVVNPDLIERAECTPDTVITMVDGHKLIVVQSLDEVVTAIRDWRASVAAAAYALSRGDDHRPVPGGAPTQDGDPGLNVARAQGRGQDDVARHSDLDAPLGRVLRMPPREG